MNHANMRNSRTCSSLVTTGTPCSRHSLTSCTTESTRPGMPITSGKRRASGAKVNESPTAMAKTATIRPLMRMRPSSMAGHRGMGLARAVNIKTDAGEDERNQNKRNRAPEKAHPEQPDRLLQGILGDLPENDADDEGRARP